MRVYVLANSNEEGTWAPDVYTTKEAALKALREDYDDACSDEDDVEEATWDEDSYLVTFRDDTFIEAAVYECEVR